MVIMHIEYAKVEYFTGEIAKYKLLYLETNTAASISDKSRVNATAGKINKYMFVEAISLFRPVPVNNPIS
jgi:hypothetical protein